MKPSDKLIFSLWLLEVPSVFTHSGIVPEFIVSEKNALVVGFCDAAAVAEATEKIISSKQLSENITSQGKADIENPFSISKDGQFAR